MNSNEATEEEHQELAVSILYAKNQARAAGTGELYPPAQRARLCHSPGW